MNILDMDGVLANFAAAACEVHGRPGYKVTRWNFFEDWGIDVDEFWRIIHACGDDFYANVVQPYTWLDKLLDIVREAGDFVVMSSPSNHPCGYAAKKIWLDKYVGPVKLIVGSEKHLLAAPNRVLVDDYDKNIDRFRAAGGHAVTFPQPWNRAAAFCSSRLEFVQYGLRKHTPSETKAA